MPRSARDSEEEVDVKPGRKTRALTETQSVDSSLRRSSRNKLGIKQNESSPESPLSDTSNTSNTQIRATRRRVTAMDNSTSTEKSRTLRSRMNSVSSDVNEITETDVGTPTKKTRSNASNEVSSKTNSRRSKRFTRAGSEANSPPTATRVRRNTRASSMEPEANTGNKLIEKNRNELVSTPIKVKRRASVLPSEATLLEEREEFTKIPMVTLDRTLPNLHEIKQLGSPNSPKAAQKRESLSTSEDKLNPSHHNIDEKATEDDTSVKGPLENPPANFTSKNFEDAEMEAPTNDKSTSDNGKNEVDNSKTLSVETIKQIESSVDDKSQVVSQNESLNTSSEMKLKLEDLNDEKHEDHSNKENLTTNVTTDSQNTETAISNTLLQSPKPLSESSINTNKPLEEKAKSPCIEIVMTPKRRHSKQLSEVSNDSVSMEEDLTNTDVVNNLPTESIYIQLTEEENSDNMPKLAITEIESVGGSQHSEHSDKCSVINVVSTSSLDDSIEIVECVEDIDTEKNDNFTEIDIESKEKANKINTEPKEKPDKIDIESVEKPGKIDTESNEKLDKVDTKSNKKADTINIESNEKPDKIDTELNEKRDEIDTESNEKPDKIDTELNEKRDEIDTESNEKSDKIDNNNKEYNEDVDMETDVSNIKESINKNEESEKDTTNENVITDDKCNTRNKDDKSNTSEKGNDNDKTNDMKTPLSSNLNNVELSESTGVKLIPDTQHSTNLEHENVHCSQNINEMSNLSSNTNTILESSDAHMSPKDSTITNINEDNVSIVIKSSHSSTVTETLAENVEAAPERGEQSGNVFVLDDSSTLKKQSTDKSELNETTSNTKQAKSKEYQESMEVDDSDSNTNVENLFQDIPASEWKNADADKNSVHSMSTERMENESEGECDLVLVDKEAWLATENIKTEKEKEAFNYDSDDTVLLKARNDAKKAQNDKRVPMDVSEDECKLNVNKDKSSNTNKRRSTKENVIKDTEGAAQDVEKSSNLDKSNKSMVKDNDQLSTSKCNVSLQKSLKDKSLSELQKTIEIEGNSPSNKLSEDVPKRRKSLKKSMQETNDKLEKSFEIVEQGKSSNKSVCKDEIDENVTTSAKKNEKSQSLNNSLTKKVKLQKLDVNLAEDSDNGIKESKAQEKISSVTKKKSQKNYVSAVNIESDSNNSNVFDSDDSQNKSVKLPKFLFKTRNDSDTGDDNESSKSMDSDIQREYNLHGRDISKFSDDDVPGDICRASETESSDPDDGGSDLADFVVDDDEVEDDGSESEEVEEGEEIEIEELDSEKDAKEQDQEDDGIEVEEEDEEMEVEEDIVPEAIQKEQQDEDDKENVDEEVTNKSLNISKNEKKKPRKSNDLSSSQIGSGKKRKKLITNTSEIASPSFSAHIETKKSKQKRASGEFLVENVELSLNESQGMFNKKMLKLSKSMECSTPKFNLAKREKSNIKACNVEEEPDSPDGEEVKNTSLKKKKLNLKKLNKTKGNETIMQRSLPSKLIDLVSNTNLSRPMSSKVSELNRTTLVPGSETPTTKYLKKQKLNESAPTLILGAKLKKLTNTSNNEEQNDQVEEDENGNSELNIEATQYTNDSLKRKVLKVADNILEKDRQKKRKKRKQPAVVERTDSLLPVENFQEDNDSETVRKNKRSVSVSNIKKNNETQNLTKKKKKKTGDSNVPIIEEIYGESTEAKLENQDKKIRNEAKKKKKKEKLNEGGLDIANANVETKKIKKKKKVSDGLDIEIVLDKQLSKKKQKKQKLSEEVVSQDQKTALGKPLKKKKQLILENDASEYEEIPIKKVPKKKRKLSKDTSDQNENISEEKVAKKKQKLLSEGVNKEKTKRNVTLKPELRKAVSDSDEVPETVAFSKARNEAFEVLKRTVDSIKANKEMKKEKQREHLEKMQKEKEIKIKKLETKSIKRLPEDVLENLSDIPIKPLKKKKISKTEEQVTLPSKPEKLKNMFVEDDFTLPSCAGSTTEFSIVDLQKIKKKKKVSEVASFRQKMLARNCRQPISAYLMYLEKQKASGKNKFSHKQY